MSSWNSEVNRIILYILVTLGLGLLTGFWFISLLITSSLFIGYHLTNLYQVNRWLERHLDNDNTPDIGGVAGNVIKLIYQYKKQNESKDAHQQKLLEQFTAAITAIPNTTLILNSNNEIEWANQSALGTLGVDSERDRGLRLDNLIRQQDFIDMLNRDDISKLSVPSPINANKMLEVHLAHYAFGKKLLIIHDISEHLELKESRKLFIANASHELRTPLTVIMGYLEFMQTDKSLPKSLRDPVNDAVIQANNMQHIIDDLLLLSKLEHKSLKKKNIERIELKQHLEELLISLSKAGKTANHTILTAVDENTYLEASRKELTSICSNLIVNAIKYSEDYSSIDIRWLKLNDNHVQFRISDEGIGIPPEHIAHITERFYRVDDSRSRDAGGTGLGLSIVKHIVERHNGTLHISSHVGEGSTFSVTFPIHFKKKKNT